MAQKPEDRYRAKLLERLRSLGGEWFITPRTRYTSSGVADILGCYRGSFVAIELKGKRGKPTEAQSLFLARVRSAGGHAFLLYDPGDKKEIAAQAAYIVLSITHTNQLITWQCDAGASEL